MPPDTAHAVALVCHPETPAGGVRGISARVCRKPGGHLAVSYVIEGHLDRVRVPAPRPQGVGRELWRHTCCEAFVGCDETPEYYEFNFSPSGEWAMHVFESYRALRTGASSAAVPAPHVAVRAAPERLELDAVICRDALPAVRPGARLRLALSAVIEDSGGVLSYWAIKHPAGKPDFHRSEAFVLEPET